MTGLVNYVPPTRNVAADPRRDFLAIGQAWTPTAAADVLQFAGNGFTLLPQNSREPIVKHERAGQTLAEKIFDTLVSLKVSVSFFAMHLSRDERRRIFDALDDIINMDDWHESDTLPTKQSFQQFLKWMIFSGRTDWTSIGVSDAGTVLAAWRKARVLLTADFESNDSVRWTVRLSGEDGEVGHTAGRCPLKLFAEQAQFYLNR